MLVPSARTQHVLAVLFGKGEAEKKGWGYVDVKKYRVRQSVRQNKANSEPTPSLRDGTCKHTKYVLRSVVCRVSCERIGLAVGSLELQQKPSREAREAFEAQQRRGTGQTRADQGTSEWPPRDLCALF